VKAHYNSIRGKIISEWKRDKNSFNLDITIPVNTTARVYLPAMDVTKIKEGGDDISSIKDVQFVKMEKAKIIEERKKGGAVREILKAKEEGLIRHAVFSTHLSGPEIRKVIEEDLFEGVTLGYSTINFPYRDEGITAAAENNMGVVIMNPLGGGIIIQNPDIFSFIKEVQPVLDKHCVSCHDFNKDEGKQLNLAGDRTNTFNTSYNELWRKKYINAIGAGPHEIQPAYSWGSHESKIIKVILAGHYDIK